MLVVYMHTVNCVVKPKIVVSQQQQQKNFVCAAVVLDTLLDAEQESVNTRSYVFILFYIHMKM